MLLLSASLFAALSSAIDNPDDLTRSDVFQATWTKGVLFFSCLMISILVLEAIWELFFGYTACGRRLARRFREAMRRNNKDRD
jgi:hypothetical protein